MSPVISSITVSSAYISRKCLHILVQIAIVLQIFRSIIKRYVVKLNIPNIFREKIGQHRTKYQINITYKNFIYFVDKMIWAENARETHLEGHKSRIDQKTRTRYT